MSAPLLRISVIGLLACLLSRVLVADTGVLAGKVVGPGGKPIAEATVSVFRAGESEPATTAITDRNGEFRVEGLVPGKWALQWKAKGYFEQCETTGGWPFRQVPAMVDVAPGDRTGVTLVMRPNAVLYGRVTDTRGRLVTNQPIWLVAAPNMHAQPMHRRVRCDGRGFYRVEFGLSREPGFGLHVPGRSGYGPFTGFTLEDGKRTRVDFRLVRGASVSGRVFAEDGVTPVAGVSVGASSPDLVVWRRFHASVHDGTLGVEWLNAVRTDTNGQFRLPLNPGVDYTLHAEAALYRSVEALDPKLRLRDGEHRGGIRLILQKKCICNESSSVSRSIQVTSEVRRGTVYNIPPISLHYMKCSLRLQICHV